MELNNNEESTKYPPTQTNGVEQWNKVGRQGLPALGLSGI
jgi:hypothetical protein